MAAKVEVDVDQIQKIRNELTDQSVALPIRMRAIFTLRNIGGTHAIDALQAGIKDPSALMRHEIAFALGQMQDAYAIPFLTSLLEDTSENSMVRHEAGEALGAIGKEESLEVLQKYANDQLPEIAETCALAIDRIHWAIENRKKKASNNSNNNDSNNGDADTVNNNEISPFFSVDPAPPCDINTPIDQLRDLLINDKLPMFKRYGALFALRDINTADSVLALVDSFACKSALLKHEVAYVLGQMRHTAATDGLLKVLHDTNEHQMVRHEAAEALGAIAEEKVSSKLSTFLEDDKEDVVVRESCAVALDITDYFTSDKFQYADSLTKQEKE